MVNDPCFCQTSYTSKNLLYTEPIHEKLKERHYELMDAMREWQSRRSATCNNLKSKGGEYHGRDQTYPSGGMDVHPVRDADDQVRAGGTTAAGALSAQGRKAP